jgi:hypothetical protein
MKIFPVPFSIANEVVKRSISDNRRLISLPERGGNNLFYLGESVQFINKFQDPLKRRLIEIQNLCNERFVDLSLTVRAMQKGQGIRVRHKISKELLVSLIPFIDSFLEQYSFLYHNPNFDKALINNKLDQILLDDLIFYSDLVFIRDSNSARPYFKWFNYSESSQIYKLVQEFLIPHISFLNFDFVSYNNEIIDIRWHISYINTVINSSDNIEALVTEAIKDLPIDTEQKETIREAITKIRIGQSQFRSDLLSSDRDSCLFTGINDPQLLIASHIKPWKESTNSERLNVNNGILLTPTFDKLFDKFLITFNSNGTIRWSQTRLNEETRRKIKLGSVENENLVVEINDYNREYYDYHRRIFESLEVIQ